MPLILSLKFEQGFWENSHYSIIAVHMIRYLLTTVLGISEKSKETDILVFKNAEANILKL